MVIFLINFVPHLVYKVYKMEHFSTEWNTLGEINTFQKIQ